MEPAFLAERTEGFSGAEIAGFIESATKRATRRYLDAHPKQDKLEELAITREDFEAELERTKRQPGSPKPAAESTYLG